MLISEALKQSGREVIVIEKIKDTSVPDAKNFEVGSVAFVTEDSKYGLVAGHFDHSRVYFTGVVHFHTYTTLVDSDSWRQVTLSCSDQVSKDDLINGFEEYVLGKPREAKEPEPKRCDCDIIELMRNGCKCGGK